VNKDDTFERGTRRQTEIKQKTKRDEPTTIIIIIISVSGTKYWTSHLGEWTKTQTDRYVYVT